MLKLKYSIFILRNILFDLLATYHNSCVEPLFCYIRSLRSCPAVTVKIFLPTQTSVKLTGRI